MLTPMRNRQQGFDEQERRIIDRWQSLMRERIPAARVWPETRLLGFGHEMIRDWLRLSTENEIGPLVKECNELAKKHAAQRSRAERYSLSDLVGEFHLFRLALLEMLPVVPLQVHSAIDSAIAVASCEYERVRVEQSELKYKLALQVTNNAIWEWDLITDKVDWTDVAKKVFGYNQNELMTTGNEWKAHLHPDDRARVVESLEMAFREHRSRWSSEYRFKRKDSQYIIISDRAYVIYDSRDQAVRMFGVMQDVTEHKEHEEMFSALASSMPQLVWLTDASGRTDFFNERWYEFTGMDRGCVLADCWKDCIHPEDVSRTLQLWSDAVATKQTFQMEHRLRRRDGKYFWHLSRASPSRLPISHSLRWFGTSTNIQDQKEAVERLETERQVRERFVATLSHDLRTPLTAIRAAAELMIRFPTQAASSTRLTNTIIEGVDRVDQMIQDILDASRIRFGQRLPMKLKEVDLVALTKEVIAHLSLTYGERFVLECPTSLQGTWSPDGLRRVLENLCSNAVKYGAPETPVRLTIRNSASTPEVEINVYNEGNPIPPEIQRTLFQQYQRGASAQKQKGWGLGLVLVKGIVEGHGGRVSLESSNENGTTFCVVLPLDARPFQ